MTLPRLLPLLLLLAPSALAQRQVRVSGLLESVTTPVLCVQRVQYRFACTDVYPVSSATSLGVYLGQIIEVEGTEAGGGLCRIVNVQRVIPNPRGSLTWIGNPTPGGQVVFTLLGPGLSAYFLFLGSGKAYLPVDTYFGTILVAPPFYVIAQGAGGGMATLTVPIPADPSLSGHQVFLQAMYHTIGPISPPFVGNSICIRIT